MRDFVILGSSIITPPPNPQPPSSSSSSSSIPQHRYTIKPHKTSLQKLPPLSPKNNSTTLLQTPLILKEFETVLHGTLDSDVDAEVLANAVLMGIKDRNVRIVIDTLNKVEEGLGEISLSTHLDASSIANECCHMVSCGHIEEAVELMEVLSRNFSIFCFFFSSNQF
jgi:hypothetical protein